MQIRKQSENIRSDANTRDFFNFFNFFLYPSKFASLPRIEVRERYRQVREILQFNFLPMGHLISPLGTSYVQNNEKITSKKVTRASM